MNVKELQIGDWVIYNGYPCEVYSLQGAYPREGRFNDKPVIDVWVGNGFLSVGEDEIGSIPLTAEILEKNGWTFMKGQDYSTFPVPSKWIYQFVPFALRVDGETYSIANTFTIKYVHELQHALRLCGLTELADSMII